MRWIKPRLDSHSEGLGGVFFVFTEEVATTPATTRNRYDSLQRNAPSLRRNRYDPSRARKS
jgi:hypothetical protein